MADIATPNVIGSTQSEAEAKLKSAGLVVGTVTTVASATVPKGTVSSAMPAAGTLVGSGSAVNLEVSSGPAPVAVPDVGGLTRAAAVDKLKSAGLKVGAVKTQHSNSVPDGGIASTDPDAGTLVSSGSPVSLEVSNGPEPNWTQFIPTVIFTLLGIVVLWLIVYGITQQGQEFLTSM